ncbi:branched-chain amino acid transport system substrate-binding protein [Rhizobium sp. SG_E_25_P2]|uniref:ABC transporter substrate-binding protein n=1 Tax=Rhizobium sp. SG_E_25_P2 TaxID=2879942 RepID=UPI00247528C5|nr:ABC transporter substrate-binding protein [Rhizobium sp. SG_E_25_P2]MDH6267229.1 branched-chain amino acid transport system substrate-binding protein [Rhizobium sp. SG_E_25_P2]
MKVTDRSGLLLNRRQLIGGAIVGAAAATVPNLFPTPAIASTSRLKIGYLSPRTGNFAPFAEADGFLLKQLREALRGGIVNKGKTYEIEFVDVDDQSNPDRATSGVQKLINADAVNLVLAQGAVTVGNVSAQCELAGIPSITTNTPWQAWMFPLGGAPDVGFEFSNHFFWGMEDIMSTYIGMWSGIETNRKVATCFTNDIPGQAFADAALGFPAALKASGYEAVDVGLFEPGANDFSRQIAAYRDAGCEIITGLFDPPDWVVFWRQAQQLGFKPKVATVAKALLFPAGIQALGPSANNMSTEIWWTPKYPFQSSITGQSAAELASAYQQDTGKRWTQPIGVIHALFETGVAALRTAEDPTDPASVQAAISAMSLDTIVGKLDWASSPIRNVAKMAIAGGQWDVADNGDFELAVTYNKNMPTVPVDRPFSVVLGK